VSAVAKTTWLTDRDGTFAPAETAARRDHMIAIGWQLAPADPADGDKVWLFHAETGGWTRLALCVLPALQPIGWAPAAPPMEPGDQGPVVVLPPPGPPEQPTTSEAEPVAKPVTQKENDRA
jgi:hypothetical protein